MQSPVSRLPPGYRLPPEPLPRIVAAEPPPALILSPDRRHIALLGRPGLPGIAELARPELRLAGVRIDPATNGPSRPGLFHSLTIRRLDTRGELPVRLPEGARLSEVRWAPDGEALAFVNTRADRLELWVVEIAQGHPRLLHDRLNGALGPSYEWSADGRALLAKLIPEGRGPAPGKPPVPSGPIVQESLGRVAPGRTYQDLLSSPFDELLFEHFFTARLAWIPRSGGDPSWIDASGIISDFGESPSGEFLLVETLQRPYSYVVPFHRFAARLLITDRSGRPVRRIVDLPVADAVPVAFDAVPQGPRNIHWRPDHSATLIWIEAQDDGDPARPAEERDRLFALSAPFSGDPHVVLGLEHRYAGSLWAGDVGLVFSRWWDTRTERRYAVGVGGPEGRPRLLLERSFDDRYNDPGTPLTVRNAAGRPVLARTSDGRSIFLSGDGASPRGNYPFLDRLDLESGATARIWQAQDPHYEEVAALIDSEGRRFITRRESAGEPPNYYLRRPETGGVVPLTAFPDPAPELSGIRREIVRYRRADGVALSATLYTPPGYTPGTDTPLPTLIWAYPREYRDADLAGQIDDSPNRFSRPAGPSHLFLLTRGYAILDGPAMPIIGEDREEPNDSYIEQLVASATAAVDEVVELGVADRNRIGIGGHSYGAFMAANLLAHTELFRAGIARSGAYNRTLTPFGFQQEQRTYWQAPEVYHRMSPFSYVDRIKAPLLLIHGEVDNNSGTFPLQTERFYHALKGHGATVRYVVLPHESHGYRALESVLHVLAEMIDWMEAHVKNAAQVSPSGLVA